MIASDGDDFAVLGGSDDGVVLWIIFGGVV